MTHPFDIGENDEPLGEQPVAKLVPIESRKPRQPGTARGLIELGEDFDAPPEDFSESMH